MKLIHHLATSTNEFPVGDLKLYTRHDQKVKEGSEDEIKHVGLELEFVYKGDNSRHAKYRWVLQFDPGESVDTVRRAAKLLPRFEPDTLPTTVDVLREKLELLEAINAEIQEYISTQGNDVPTGLIKLCSDLDHAMRE